MLIHTKFGRIRLDKAGRKVTVKTKGMFMQERMSLAKQSFVLAK